MVTEINNTGTDLQGTPSQDGVVPVKGMRGLSQQTRTDLESLNTEMSRQGWGRVSSDTPASYIGAVGSIVPENFGESVYDEELFIPDVVQSDKSLNNLRAERQSTVAKLGSGLLGAASMAGTTFTRGTLGFVVGGVTALAEQRVSGLWDNEVTRALDEWDSFVDEQAPIYLTKYEEEHPWKTIFSAGNIANTIIKNAGFMIGAALSGQAYAGAFRSLGIASKLGSKVSSVNTATKTSNAARAGYELAKNTMQRQGMNASTSMLTATMSAIGEGSFEAANNSREWEETQVALREREFAETMSRPDVQRNLLEMASATIPIDEFSVIDHDGQRIVDYDAHRQAVNEAYNTILRDEWNKLRNGIHEKALKMGNADMLMNIPLLAAGNWIAFGRLIRGGYRANKLASSAIRGTFKSGFTRGISKAAKVGAVAVNPFTEGLEEMNQAVIAEGASIWTADELDSFIDDRYNPQAERETSDFFTSMWNGMVDTYTNTDNWVEFVYGALMGAMPIPVARRTSKGNIGLGVNWEMGNRIREAGAEISEADELVEYLNNRISDPKFQSEWNSMVANSTMQSRMNRTTEDPFNFKNCEHRQLVHDLVAIEKAGKLDLFKEQVQDWLSQPNTPEFVDSIKDATTDEGGRSWMDGLSRDEIYTDFQNRGRELIDTIEFFGQASKNIRTTYGDRFSDDALDEMVYIRTQIDDWYNRADNIRTSLNKGGIPSAIRGAIGELTDTQRELLDWLESPNQDIAILQEGDLTSLVKFFNTAVGSSNIVDKDQAIQDLTDLVRISLSVSNGIATYNRHIFGASELNDKIEKKKEKRNKEIKREEDTEKVSNVSDALSNTSTYSEISSILDSVDLSDIPEQILEGAQEIADAKEKVDRVEVTKRVSKRRAKDPVGKAVDDLVNRAAETLPIDMMINPETAVEVYTPALVEAIANGEITVPEDAGETFTADVVKEVEAVLERAQNDYERFSSAPTIFPEEYIPDPEELDLSSATEIPGESITEEIESNKLEKAIDEPLPELLPERDKDIISSPVISGSTSMIYTAVPEIHKEAAKFMDGHNERVHPDNEAWVIWERRYNSERKPTDFRLIYQRLVGYGAFEYLRTHVITPGTDIYFVVDTGFRNYDPQYGIPIFLAIKDSQTGNLQIIGAAPSYKTTKVEKLKMIGEQLEKAVNSAPSRIGLIESRETTKVSRVNDGTFISSIKDEPTVVNSEFVGGSTSLLGIVVNGQISTKNGSIPITRLSTSITDFTRYNGRPVLLVRATSGKYKIMPLRTKTVALSDGQDDSNRIFPKILSTIDELITSSSTKEDVDTILKLKSYMYMPNIYIRTSIDRLGNKTLIIEGREDRSDIRKTVLLQEAVPLGETPTLSRESIAENTLNALISLDPIYQLSVRNLEQDPDYENEYIESGILYTDIDSPKIYGSWLVFDEELSGSRDTIIKETLTSTTEVKVGKTTYRNSPEGWRKADGSLVTNPLTLAAINKRVIPDSTPKAASPRPKISTINTFGVGRVANPIVKKPKGGTAMDISKSQRTLENTNNLLIFAKLDSQVRDTLIKQGISESDFNNMSRAQQDKIIECYS